MKLQLGGEINYKIDIVKDDGLKLIKKVDGMLDVKRVIENKGMLFVPMVELGKDKWFYLCEARDTEHAKEVDPVGFTSEQQAMEYIYHYHDKMMRIMKQKAKNM